MTPRVLGWVKPAAVSTKSQLWGGMDGYSMLQVKWIVIKENYRDLPLLQATSRRKVLALSASSKAVRRPMTEVCLRCTEKFVVYLFGGKF